MTPRVLLITAVAIAGVVRGGLLITQGQRLRDDPDAYRAIAICLAETRTFGLIDPETQAGMPTAFRPPLYPRLLSWFVDGDGLAVHRVAALHWVLGLWTVALTADIGRRLFSSLVGLIASVLVTLDPILVTQQSLVMTETLAVTLVTSVWWWIIVFSPIHWSAGEGHASALREITTHVIMRFAIILGLGLLACIFCRPTFLVWGVLLIGLPFVGALWQADRTRFFWCVTSSCIVVVFAVGIGAWTTRNWVRLGAPIWATTHGGYTMLLANNKSFFDYADNADRHSWLPWDRRPWDPAPFFAELSELRSKARQSGLVDGEVSADRFDSEQAIACIRQSPVAFVKACLIRVGRLWHPFPMRIDGRSRFQIVVVGTFYGVIFSACTWAFFRHRFWRDTAAWWPAVSLAITLTGIHAVYWSNARMRAPALPMFAVAAASLACIRPNPSHGINVIDAHH